MPIKRSNEMVMLAYFLAKYGEKSQEGRSLAPKELEGQPFDKIFESFYPQLGGGRTLRTFIGSMNPTVRYFRNSKNVDHWLRNYQDEHPWLKHSRDQLWSELQRLRGTTELQVVSPKVSRRSASAESRFSLEREQHLADAEGHFSPLDANDARKRIFRSIALRLGQHKFREQLLAAYGGKCCMTGTTATEVLEAAHIQAYSRLGTNSVTNGLLLRSDLHVLFDLFMVSVDPESGSIYCAQVIRDVPPYSHLHGTRMRLPEQRSNQPDTAALRHHYETAIM